MSKSFRPYSSLNRRSRGNMRAADQQRDSFNIVLRHKLNIAAGQTLDAIRIEKTDDTYDNEILEKDLVVVKNTGCAFINVFDVIRKSEYYQNISSLYDQIKINAIKVDVTAIDWPNSSNESEANEDGYVFPKSLSVVTAWDRSGLGADQIQFLYSTPNVEKPVYKDIDVDEEFSDRFLQSERKFYSIVGNKISSYSSSLIRHLGPGSNLRLTRYLYPENFNEKSQYVSTDSLKPQYEVDYSGNYNVFNMYDVVYDDSESLLRRQIIPYKWDTTLPTNPVNNSALPFKPIFLIGVIAGEGPTYRFQNGRIIYGNKLKPTTFCLDFSIDCTFRGLRFNKIIE